MNRTFLFFGFAALPFAFASCGTSSSETGDNPSQNTAGAPSESAGQRPCERDADCDDGVHCNGTERCSPSVAGADPFGCLAAEDSPCGSGTSCHEPTETCVDECDQEPDQDGDGFISIACGGDDCDDDDSGAFPGNEEVCDSDNKDEDCDPNTFGFRDEDSDGWPDAACCNGDNCGTDCDDKVAVVHPTENELCDGLDNDCNGEVDEGVAYGDLPIWYRDADGDGFGLLTAQTAECADEVEGYVRIGGDCDDLDPVIHPGASERCDGLDNDCDPGSHACWLQTKSTTSVDVEQVGVITEDTFEIDCSSQGNMAWNVQLFNDKGGLQSSFAWCASMQGAPDPNQCSHGSVSGLSQGTGEWVNTPDFDDPELEIINSTCSVEAAPINEDPKCHDDSSPLSFLGQTTGIHLATDPSGALRAEGIACNPAFMFDDSLELVIRDGVTIGEESEHTLACPDRYLVVGFKGSLTPEGRVSSLGLICRTVIGVEHD